VRRVRVTLAVAVRILVVPLTDHIAAGGLARQRQEGRRPQRPVRPCAPAPRHAVADLDPATCAETSGHDADRGSTGARESFSTTGSPRTPAPSAALDPWLVVLALAPGIFPTLVFSQLVYNPYML